MAVLAGGSTGDTGALEVGAAGIANWGPVLFPFAATGIVPEGKRSKILGTNGTPVALAARTGARVGACE